MAFCSSCGNKVYPGAQFCFSCGATQTGVQNSQTPQVIQQPVQQPVQPQVIQHVQNQQNQNFNNLNNNLQSINRSIMLNKDFVGPAILTFVLYYFGFYLAGLIANFIYLSSAKNIKRATGISPSGKGCLDFLIITHFWLPLIGGGLFLVALVFVALVAEA